MTRNLPTGNFRWVEPQNFKLENTNESDDVGYFLEVDLEVPEELHDKFKYYPPAPETMVVTDDMLSPYCKQLAEELNLKTGGATKLIQSLLPKEKYVIHYVALKRYLQLGMKLTKIHRIISFNQDNFMASYIMMNTKLRSLATNDFEKDFLKLMNNALFGKTIENLRNRALINLVIDEDKLLKLIAKPSYVRTKILDEGLVAVERKKVNLVLNKPQYIGVTVLDLSKELMYNFYYNVLYKKYGDGLKLLFTDTGMLSDTRIYFLQICTFE